MNDNGKSMQNESEIARPIRAGIRAHGDNGWEAWHMEMIRDYREIFFKRRSLPQPSNG